MWNSYRNQSINLHCKSISIDWFQHERNVLLIWAKLDYVQPKLHSYPRVLGFIYNNKQITILPTTWEWGLVFIVMCKNYLRFNPIPIQDRSSWGCSRMEESKQPPPSPPLPKTCHPVNPTLWNPQRWNLALLYLTYRRSKRYINHVMHPLSSTKISIFSPESSSFSYIMKCR